jgi:transcriptional regulator
VLTTRHDAPLSDEEWRTFLATQDFGQLIAAGCGRDVPVVVPAHYRYDPGANAIEFHLHRDNPVWAALTENPRAVFAVVDAHVYVPTHWNAAPGTAPEWSAPTSYYAAVQAIGTAEIVDDPHALAGLLTRQMRQMQPEGGYAPIEPGPSPFGRMLKGIRGLRLEVADVRAKFKFGGNKGYEHRVAIAERLAERGTSADLRARDYLLRRRAAL